jgi:ABC-type nitrate/sulfonate/bicarbonate transport system substrate-binding protein
MKIILRFVHLALVVVVLFTPVASSAQPLATIRVSYQPNNYWALPFYVASEKHLWAAEGLTPEFSTFPSGAPQVTAGATDAWDVGGTGSAPALAGAARYGLLTIGITNDESATNAVMIRGDARKAWLKDPARDIKGRTALVTTTSTGEYVLLSYLKSIGLTKNDVKIVPMDQSLIVSSFAGTTGDLFVLWAPNIYTVMSRGAEMLANGKTGGVTVPGALVATPKFAKEKPELVAKFLRVYFKAIEWQQQNHAEAVDMLARFNQQGGVVLDKKWFEEEFKTRPVWTIPGQLELLARKDGKPSTVDGWFSAVGDYFIAAGTLKEKPDPTKFIIDEFMKKAAGGPKR